MMKMFVKKFVIFILVFLILISLFIAMPYSSSYNFFVIKKKHALLQVEKDKKIVLVGGSNILYSLSAEDMTKKLGFNVINMGLNAGLGLKYNLNEIKPYLKKGDMVVVSPEYGNFEDMYWGNANLMQIYCLFPKSREFIQKDHLMTLIMSNGLQFFQVKSQSYIDSVFVKLANSNTEINDYGDIVSKNKKRDVSKFRYSLKVNDQFEELCYKTLDEFSRFCHSNDITLFYAFPYLPDTEYERNRGDIEKIENKIGKIENMHILYPSKTAKMDSKYFLDTVYHLTSQGRALRTCYTTEKIQSFLEQKK
ncbi:MAG: hypothetical protein N2645_14200 [Clostridia bacterium]|nr:hypothetical protein [Clostridia bacterium]